MASQDNSSGPPKPRARKRLVVCCDGTWQSSVTIKKNVPSNITRLARSIAREDVVTDKDGNETLWEQIVYYDAGIGTGEISKSEKDRQGGFGHGFVANVIEAYNFLALNYREGDKVYCFGFSRGAYTARAVAGLVNDIGIISPRDMQDFPELYTAYSEFKEGGGSTAHTFRNSRAYRKWQTGVVSTKGNDKTTGLVLYDQIPHARVSEESRLVEVVGVFDTVGSLGVPDSPYYTVDALMAAMNYWWGGEKPGFHNVNLSPYIANAFHAMALDEHRAPFSPTLWHRPPPPKGMAVEDESKRGTYTEDEVEQWKAKNEELAATREAASQHFKKLHYEKLPAIERFRAEAKDMSAKMQEKYVAEKEEDYEKEVDEAWGALIDSEMVELCHKIRQSHMKQTWLPGMHIHIGGGSDDPLVDRLDDFEQIALISFAWMTEQVRPFLRFEERLRKRSVRDRMALIIPVKAEIAAGGNKDFGSWGKSFWKALDSTGLKKATSKQIADTTVCGWATGPIIDSYTGSVKATGSKTRTPGQYRKIPKSDKLLGETFESIHPSVAYRMKAVKGYNPPALEGFKRVWDSTAEPKQWVWKHPNGTEVPEFKIPEDAKFSRFLTHDYTKFLQMEEQKELREKKGVKTAGSSPKSVAPPTEATKFLEDTDIGVDWINK